MKCWWVRILFFTSSYCWRVRVPASIAFQKASPSGEPARTPRPCGARSWGGNKGRIGTSAFLGYPPSGLCSSGIPGSRGGQAQPVSVEAYRNPVVPPTCLCPGKWETLIPGLS